MIVQLESARVQDLLAAWRELVNLGYRWGEDMPVPRSPQQEISCTPRRCGC